MDPHSFIARAEAQRWVGIAEKLLMGHDLVGSKTFAIRARDSDPRLEAADQILAIADTLLAAEKRVVGNNGAHQPDYYAILQLVRFVQDAEHIASQYRRLAVLLNPHQNRFPYSDQAFQLVNDAWAVLSNPMRKSLYDAELDFSPQQQQMDPLGFNLEQQHQHQQQQHQHQHQHQQQHQHNFFSINHMGAGHEQELPEQPQTFQTRLQQSPQQQQLQQHNFLSQPNPVRPLPVREQEHLFHHREQEQLFQPQVQPFQVTSSSQQQTRTPPQPPQPQPPIQSPSRPQPASQPPFSWPQTPHLSQQQQQNQQQQKQIKQEQQLQHQIKQEQQLQLEQQKQQRQLEQQKQQHLLEQMQQKQQLLKQEQLKQEQLKQQQLKQEQLKQQQQEKLKQEQLQQEQLKQQQLLQEQRRQQEEQKQQQMLQEKLKKEQLQQEQLLQEQRRQQEQKQQLLQEQRRQQEEQKQQQLLQEQLRQQEEQKQQQLLQEQQKQQQMLQEQQRLQEEQRQQQLKQEQLLQEQRQQQEEQKQQQLLQEQLQQQESIKQNAAPVPLSDQVNSSNGAREEETEAESETADEDSDDSPTFWTACPYCFYMYEYPRVYAECTLSCDNCKRAFQAVRISTPPPIIEGQDAYFYCWGFIPVGVRMSHLQNNNSKGKNSKWSPFSPLYDASNNAQNHLNCNAAPKENLFVNKSSGPRIYVDDITDDVFIDVSEPSEDSDFEWDSTKKQKLKRMKKGLNRCFKERVQVLALSAQDVRNGTVENLKHGILVQEGIKLPTLAVAETKMKALGTNPRKKSGRVAKEVGKLDLNVEFNNNEGEEPAPRMNGGNRGQGHGQGEEDNIGFFEGLDEFLSSLPILSVVNEEKVKA